ncbi:hypothetical protein LNV47_22715 [Paucibacter sp. DJ4R-1]|nr:hypothetical protein [Paucibacter sp. DJ4R-1]
MLAAAQIRAHVAQLLQPCAFTGGRVFAGRYWPVTESEMPCWFVAIDQEDMARDGISYPGLQTHRLRLLVDGFVAEVDALEAALDTLQTEALEALFAAQPPFHLSCVGTRRRVAEAEGQAGRVGVLSLYLEATFLTVEGQPQTLIP